MDALSPVPPLRSSASSNSGVLYSCAASRAAANAASQFGDLVGIGVAALVLLGLEHVVGSVNLVEGSLFCGVIRRADSRCPLEGHVLEHVRQPRNALDLIYRPHVGIGGERSDGRIVAFRSR